MRIFRWWLVRAEYGDVHDLPPWAYDEVIGSRWQSGLLELRVKKLTRREGELEEEVVALQHELAVARGEVEEEVAPAGTDLQQALEEELDHDLASATTLSTEPGWDQAAASMRGRFRRRRQLNGHVRPDTAETPVWGAADDERG